jgi:hypothetical protein
LITSSNNRQTFFCFLSWRRKRKTLPAIYFNLKAQIGSFVLLRAKDKVGASGKIHLNKSISTFKAT